MINIGNNNKINKSIIGNNNKKEPNNKILLEIVIGVLVGVIVAAICYFIGLK